MSSENNHYNQYHNEAALPAIGEKEVNDGTSAKQRENARESGR